MGLKTEMRVLLDYFGAWAEEREVGLKMLNSKATKTAHALRGYPSALY